MAPAFADGLTSSGAPQITPFMFSANGANQVLTATAPFVSGRTLFITAIAATASGSTAGAQVNLVLFNVNNNGVAANNIWTFVFPAGALVSAQPIIQTFSPPLQGSASLSVSLQLGAGGAGNTAAAISLIGYYQ